MKHATPEALDQLESLLDELRTIPELRERKRGVFYRRSKAFLHFHEDPAGLFADMKNGVVFERHPVNTSRECQALVRLARRLVAG